MKLPSRATAIIGLKVLVGVAAGVLSVKGHLSPDLAHILELIVGSLGLTGLAHAVGDIAKGTSTS